MAVFTNTSELVLAAQSSCVPVTGTKSGCPLKMMSSVGTWLIRMAGTPLASEGRGLAWGPPVSMSTAPVRATVCAVAASPFGSTLVCNQGPCSDAALSQPSYTWR